MKYFSFILHILKFYFLFFDLLSLALFGFDFNLFLVFALSSAAVSPNCSSILGFSCATTSFFTEFTDAPSAFKISSVGSCFISSNVLSLLVGALILEASVALITLSSCFTSVAGATSCTTVFTTCTVVSFLDSFTSPCFLNERYSPKNGFISLEPSNSSSENTLEFFIGVNSKFKSPT